MNYLKLTDKESFTKYVNEQRDCGGGLIMALIVPPSLKDWYSGVKPVEPLNETEEFYLYGTASFCYEIYVDKALTNAFYIVCNIKTVKVMVQNVP